MEEIGVSKADFLDALHGNRVKVMRVRVDVNGPELIIPESRKDELWDMCEDWIGKIEIRFTSMTQAEVDALPDFAGF